MVQAQAGRGVSVSTNRDPRSWDSTVVYEQKLESAREASRPAGQAAMITSCMAVVVSKLYLAQSPVLRDRKRGCQRSGVKQKKTLD